MKSDANKINVFVNNNTNNNHPNGLFSHSAKSLFTIGGKRMKREMNLIDKARNT